MMHERQPVQGTLTARWVFPVEGPPLPGGRVTVAGGRIRAVEPAGSGRADHDLGDTALVPGLVNAHTHLDLTGMRGVAPPQADFPAWLRAVLRHRQQVAPERVAADVQAGIAECLATGTTLVGDIASQGQSWDLLRRSPLRAVVFYELLGLTRERARQAWQLARQWLATHPADANCRPGLSPHAPYSVRAALFRQTAAWCRRHALPLATHLAESPAELQLLHDHAGPFVEFLVERGVWDPHGLVAGVEALLRLVAGAPAPLLVHGNYLAADAPLPRGCTVVYCPRTHAAFGHAPHPFRALLRAGHEVALGTDGLASNPDLDLLAEARFVSERHPDLPGAALLRMATLAGARALGWEAETGSLAPGKSADLVVLALPRAPAADPHALLFHPETRVRAVLLRGAWVQGSAGTAS